MVNFTKDHLLIYRRSPPCTCTVHWSIQFTSRICHAGNLGKMSVQSIGTGFCPSFLQTLHKNFDGRNCNDVRRELIPIFHDPHRKCRPSPSAVARTLQYLVGVPTKATTSGREEKQARMKIQEIREYLECGSRAGTKSAPLQSLIVGEVPNASYQP